jgi:hypothetical protein
MEVRIAVDENLIIIYESEGIGRVWLQDKLEEENIPYKVDFEQYWTSIKDTKFHAKQYILVDVSYEKPVKGFINEYNNADFSSIEDNALINDFENVLPQITCPACGEEIYLDYPRCPFCKHELDI